MQNHRILLYGASNLWLSRRAALTELRRRFDGHLQIGLANGPGRSYGLNAGNPMVHYEALKNVDFGFTGTVSGTKLALLTDIGNDIAYSQNPELICRWISTLAGQLREQDYKIIVGGIPAESLSKMNPLVFKTVAKLYYPDGTVKRKDIIEKIFELQSRISEICKTQNFEHYPLKSDWYTFDRFHLKGSACVPYWASLFENYPRRNDFDSRKNLALRQPLQPRRYWLRGKEKRGQERYGNLVPQSLTFVR